MVIVFGILYIDLIRGLWWWEELVVKKIRFILLVFEVFEIEDLKVYFL